MVNIIYILDLIGTLAFAVGGAYKAKSRKLNIFGVILLGVITAIGGGTIRDLILGRTPLFYLIDPNYLILSIIAGFLIYFIPNFFKKTYSIFRFTDSIGIATFAIIGVSICYNQFNVSNNSLIMTYISCILMGTITAVGGGVIRDTVMGDVPYAVKKGSNYVSSAFAGSLIFLLLMPVNNLIAIIASFTITLVFREVLSEYGIYKKVFLTKKAKFLFLTNK